MFDVVDCCDGVGEVGAEVVFEFDLCLQRIYCGHIIDLFIIYSRSLEESDGTIEVRFAAGTSQSH